MISAVKPICAGAQCAYRQKIIYIDNILQYPELPTGCEIVSLTMLLNYHGYNADKITLAREYLPKLGFYYEGGVYYGADFRTTFAGDPESENSYGCYAPCIVTAAERFLSDNGSRAAAHDISGAGFDELLSDYIDNDSPVLIWITSGGLHETIPTSVWTTPDGEIVQWKAYEHCAVLTGYDLDCGVIYVSDPMYGNITYDYKTARQRYEDMGSQAVCIEPITRSKGANMELDIDGDGAATSADALIVLRFSLSLDTLPDDKKLAADIDNDGLITSADALSLLRTIIFSD